MRYILLITLLALFPACAFAKEPAREDSRPNIVLIFTDDQGMHDVGCYGSEISTPHIDSLARDGLKFTSCYAAAAVCTPSRYGLLTGRNPSRSRDQLLFALMFMEQEDASRGIQPGETTIASLLQGAGYHTALLGKWHLGHGGKRLLPNAHGFDIFRGHTGGCIDYFTMTYGNIPDWHHNAQIVSENGYATELITADAVQYIKQRKEKDDPFFLYLAYNAPHFGKGWSPKEQKPINIMQAEGDDLKRVADIKDKVRREFAAMTVSLDDGVGEVLKALDETKLAKDTLVIFMTDHGGDPVYGGANQPYRGGKATLFEGGVRVPCLMRWPGRIKAGSTTDEVATALDIVPTFCTLAGVEKSPAALDGQDISPLLLAGEPTGDRELLWELGPHRALGRGKWTALRHGDWKYVQDADGQEYLFDIARDPLEKRNLAPAQKERTRRLQQRAKQLGELYRRAAP